MDLGATSFQTFRYIMLPIIATAMLAGGLLAFALSFDEIIVTTFTAGQQQTLPIWIFSQLARPRQRPVTNVAAVFVISTHVDPDHGRGAIDAAGQRGNVTRTYDGIALDRSRSTRYNQRAFGMWCTFKSMEYVRGVAQP